MLVNIEKIKGLWGKLLHQEATPNQIAAGFSIGFFISFLPIPGFQTLAALILAFLLRINKVACLVGLHMHLVMFPVIPLVFVAEYNIGKDLLHFHYLHSISPEHFNLLRLLHKGWPFFCAMVVGSLVLGLPSALVSYWCVKCTAIRWQDGREGQDNADKPSTKRF